MPSRADRREPEWQWRSSAYAWWVVIVLALCLTLSLADRLIMALMIGAIKRDLDLTDTEISLLQGLAFSLLYVFAGLPLGRFADSRSRRGLAAASVIAWSAMTGACGLSKSFGQLFVARLGVGVGEAGLSPAAVSLVCDYFPPRQRSRPLAFLSVGSTAGAGLALMFGGLMVHAIGASEHLSLPVLGEVSGWQAVFLVLGCAGILFGAIFLTIREPERQERSTLPKVPVAAVAGFIRQRGRYFIAQLLGPSFSVYTLIAFHSWMPTLLIRRFHWTAAKTGIAYGACIGIAGLCGIVFGGWLAQRRTQAGDLSAPLTIATVASLLAAAPLLIAPLMPNPFFVLFFVSTGLALIVIPSALGPAMLQSVCPNEMRGQLFSVYLLVMSSIAYILGPLSVAWTTDHIFCDENAVYKSLALVAAAGVSASAIALFFARREHRALLAAAR
jgi:MFS family permease